MELASHGKGSTFLALTIALWRTSPTSASQRGALVGEGLAGEGSADDSASSGTTTGRGTIPSIADRGVQGGRISSFGRAQTSLVLSCLQLGGGGGGGHVASLRRLQVNDDEREKNIAL